RRRGDEITVLAAGEGIILQPRGVRGIVPEHPRGVRPEHRILPRRGASDPRLRVAAGGVALPAWTRVLPASTHGDDLRRRLPRDPDGPRRLTAQLRVHRRADT